MLATATKRRAPPETVQALTLPAPMGGLNTIDSATDTPTGDCISLVNLVADQLGLRARYGWAEWCTGLNGLEVRTELTFKGPSKNGGADRLFACTPTGIWDVTSSSQTPTQVVTFLDPSGDAGYGVGYTYVTPAGAHFLVYADEQNGYYLYSQSTTSWQKVVSATQTIWAPSATYVAGQYVSNGGAVFLCTTGGVSVGSAATAWANSTAYVIGQYITNNGNVYVCTQNGTSSGTTTGPSGIGTAISDGTCVWNFAGPSGTGTGITDGTCVWSFNYSVSGVDPAQFCYVLAWKNRLWFVQRDTAQAWFLGIGSIAGAATQQNFGSQFKQGGFLVGLWNWTLDGGLGIDNYLVAISGAGDVAIYQGTDPTTVGTFGLKGVWNIGAVPYGRRIATEFGGDLLILSAVGAIPLTRVVNGNSLFDPSQYETRKIANLFNQYFQLYGGNRGWAVRLNPLDNSVFILVPSAPATTQPTTVLVMSLARRSWSIYPDIPIFSAESFNGTLYFGTNDGRVCTHSGYLDAVLLSAPGVGNNITWSLLTAFQNLGSPKKKRVHQIRPHILAQTLQPNYTARARFDFDTSALAAVSGTGAASGSVWDSAIWDQAVWQGDYSETEQISGSTGMGVHVALAVKGNANSKTVLAGFDIAFDVGGFF